MGYPMRQHGVLHPTREPMGTIVDCTEIQHIATEWLRRFLRERAHISSALKSRSMSMSSRSTCCGMAWHGMALHPLRRGALQFSSRTAAPIHPTRYAMLPQCQPNAALLKYSSRCLDATVRPRLCVRRYGCESRAAWRVPCSDRMQRGAAKWLRPGRRVAVSVGVTHQLSAVLLHVALLRCCAAGRRTLSSMAWRDARSVVPSTSAATPNATVQS